MQCFINGREVELPDPRNGVINSDVIRQLAQLPPSRALVLQRPDGANLVINPGESVPVAPRSHFVDAPVHVRG